MYDSSMIGMKARDFVMMAVRSICSSTPCPAGGRRAGSRLDRLSLRCVPARYIHSHAGIIHRDDFDAAVLLMTEVAMRLDASAAEAIKGE